MSLVRRTIARVRGDRPAAVVVYTVVTGGYDPLRVPGSVTPGYDYVAFLDDGTPDVTGPWQRRPATVMERSPDLAARYYKLHPQLLFPDHDASVYIDASFDIRGDISQLVATALRRHDLGLFRHPERHCIYEEARCVIDWRLDHAETVERQMAGYRAAGYPEDNGLFSGGIIVRRHHEPLVVRTMEDWWREIQANSYRDQLSLPVVLARNGLEPFVIEGSVFSNQYAEWKSHPRRSRVGGG